LWEEYCIDQETPLVERKFDNNLRLFFLKYLWEREKDGTFKLEQASEVSRIDFSLDHQLKLVSENSSEYSNETFTQVLQVIEKISQALFVIGNEELRHLSLGYSKVFVYISFLICRLNINLVKCKWIS
jgi:hypothetical protein